MKKSHDIIYLTRKEWEAYREQKHQDRLALHRRVERGELTPEQANREASIFAYVPSVLEQPIDFAAEARRLTAKPRQKRNGRRAKTTIRA